MVSYSKRCPKCGSVEVEIYDDLAFIRCKKCGYDELESESFPYGTRKSAKEKESYNPYKTGGKRRVQKG